MQRNVENTFFNCSNKSVTKAVIETPTTFASAKPSFYYDLSTIIMNMFSIGVFRISGGGGANFGRTRMCEGQC